VYGLAWGYLKVCVYGKLSASFALKINWLIPWQSTVNTIWIILVLYFWRGMRFGLYILFSRTVNSDLDNMMVTEVPGSLTVKGFDSICSLVVNKSWIIQSLIPWCVNTIISYIRWFLECQFYIIQTWSLITWRSIELGSYGHWFLHSQCNLANTFVDIFVGFGSHDCIFCNLIMSTISSLE
jgi:hypothetical protein